MKIFRFVTKCLYAITGCLVFAFIGSLMDGAPAAFAGAFFGLGIGLVADKWNEI